MRVLSDQLRGIGGRVNEDLLGQNENARGRFELLDVKGSRLIPEFHQVQRSQVAGCVVDEDVLRARIRGVNRLCALASVPTLNGAIILKSRITTDPSSFGYQIEKFRGVLLLDNFT